MDSSVVHSLAHADLPEGVMALTDQEYEDAYREAMRCLAEDGHEVQMVELNGNGKRKCLVDGTALDDMAVISLWWGDTIAQEILEGR